jgi:hypothetical protein
VATTTANITKAPLTITADAKNRPYNTANPEFTVQYSGFLGGDNQSAVSGLSVTSTATQTSNVGTYPITPSGATAMNYSIAFVDGVLTICKANQTINFPAIGNKIIGSSDFSLGATASSSLPVTYSVVSGPATVTGNTVHLTGVGLVTIRASQAGNGNYNAAANADQAFMVTFAGNSGVLQPINQDGSSVVKKGSTVPVKIKVFDANGASVGTPGTIASFIQVDSTYNASAQINETVESTTPDTAFRWDATAQQWIFNVSTKNFTAGVKYFFRITLADGSTVNFAFTTK